MRKYLLFTVAACILLVHLTTGSGFSCVGRVLTLAVNDSLEQKVVGTLLATYITERTGTTVNLTPAPNTPPGEDPLKKCEADIYLDYLGRGLAGMQGTKASGNTQKDYGLVKQYYNEKFDLVWLKPLGYKGPLNDASAQPSLAVPVTSTEVLNRFPVLDRVINKLGGRLDQTTLDRLLGQAETGDVNKVVKQFLKDRNLI